MADEVLTGGDGVVSFSSGGAEISSIVGRLCVVRGRIFRQKFRVTRPLYLQHRYAYGPWDGGAVLRLSITDDGHPALPSAPTLATMLIKQDTSLQVLTLKGCIHGLGNIGYNSLVG